MVNNVALSVDGLTFGYRNALYTPLSFDCRRGEVCAILGANGRGKTSLLNAVMGLYL